MGKVQTKPLRGVGSSSVANGSISAQSAFPAIPVFAYGSKGNAAPLRVLTDAQTGIHSVEAMTVDKSSGQLFVVDIYSPNGAHPVTSILRFAARANGNGAPLAATSPFSDVNELARDSTGENIIEAAHIGCSDEYTTAATTCKKEFANNQQPTVLYSVFFFQNRGVADDPTTKTYIHSFRSYWYNSLSREYCR